MLNQSSPNCESSAGLLWKELSPDNAGVPPANALLGFAATLQQSISLQERLNEVVELTATKRDLEAQLQTVQKRLTAIEEPLLEDMALAGMSSATVNGYTVYSQREFYARTKEGVSREDMIQGLQAAGLSHCIGLVHQTLRALAREWAELGEAPPQAITNLIDMGDVVKLRVRRA